MGKAGSGSFQPEEKFPHLSLSKRTVKLVGSESPVVLRDNGHNTHLTLV